MKVYIITQGTYSEYEIVTVFTDKAKADQFVELHNKNVGYSSCMVEEWDTETKTPRVYYRVSLRYNLRTGEPEAQPAVRCVGARPASSFKYHRGTWTGLAFGNTPEKATKALWDGLAKAKAEMLDL